MKTPISYYGGKQQLLPVIMPIIPAHKIYTESFFGGGAVYWAKEPVKIEVVNDYNGNVANFYKVLQTRFDDLNEAIKATMHSRSTYKPACVIYALPWLFDELQRAWAFWVCTNQGFQHQVGSWGFDYIGKQALTTANKKEAFTSAYAERMKLTTIENNDACTIIERWDNPDAFHYVDPPYVDSDQGHYGGYTQDHFNGLMDSLSNVKGKFLMSSYPNDSLTEYAQQNGWHQKEIKMHLSASSKAGKKKVEVLTANYEL